MKDSFSKIFLALMCLLVGLVIGFMLANFKCKNKEADQVWPQMRKDFNEYLDKMSKQTQEFEEKLKQLTEREITKKE